MIENPLTEFLVQNGGTSVYISAKDKKERRDLVVIEEFDRLIVGKTSKEVIGIISRTHYLSERTVRRIIKRRSK